MAAFGSSFESASSIEERKESKRQARQEVLEKAKQQHEKEERRKELKRLRGEDTWMLPEVNQRLQEIEEESSGKKKKKEKKSKKKKEKKEKKKKDKKEKVTGPGDGSSDSSELFVLQRDEWMTFDFLAMKTTSTTERRAEKDKQKEEERAKAQAIEQAGLHKLELNPFWKDGGSGLPSEETADKVVQKASVVNDGGLSWLRKSYQRMKEQAEREQRSLSDVVSARYGSMEEFQQRLAEAEKAVYGERRGGEGSRRDRERWRRSDRDSSPRQPDRYRDRQRDRNGDGEKDRDNDGFRARDRNRDRERNRERDVNRGRDEDRDWDKDRERSSSSSSGKDRDQQPLSLGSLKSRFLKPSDEDDMTPGRFFKQITLFAKFSSEQIEMKLMCCVLYLFILKSESGSESEEDDVPLLSEEEMNKLGAKLVKAELMGNTAMIEKLKSQLDSARKAKESHAARQKLQQDTSKEEQEVVLFRTDQSGRAWPVNAPSGSAEPHGGRRKKKAIETHVDGERVRYFQDDDHMGLQEMVRREKMSSAQDQNALYSRMAAKMMGKTDGDNYTLDDMFVSSAAQREGEGREEERMRSKAIGESRQLAATMEKCRHCFSSPDLPKHLVVALGSKAYLSLPAGVSMTEGHCIVCPLQHHSCATGLDEDVWGEMQIFRRALVRMFESQDLDCVFMETHMNPRRRQHMVLECIPLPKELGDMAPIYFKKAIMECDDEWAMNKKVVDLSSKDIRHAVPRGLPYFAVDFGMQGGFAHVIENEQKFPHYFGKEVVGGMMDLEPRRWRKLIKENFDDQRKKVLQFAQWWKPYDCTKTDD
uniref:CWF19-like protein 2 n=1 Tax=Neogobius melanostomus TaxID=47308 RepID=A0A8C6U2R3_9GOBI